VVSLPSLQRPSGLVTSHERRSGGCHYRLTLSTFAEDPTPVEGLSLLVVENV